MNKIDQIFSKMIKFDKGDVNRIQHFTKVYAYAHLIGTKEGLEPDKQYILDVAAIVHDIGILPAEKKYGYHNGKLQEKIGPGYARELLENLQIEKSVIQRVEFLISHHHTYKDVDSIDWQILLEADFLVNSFEKKMSKETIADSLQKWFKTKSGIELCKDMYALEKEVN